MIEPKNPKDIEVRVTDQDGNVMTLTVPWDSTLEDWAAQLKTILTFLTFDIYNVVINQEEPELETEEGSDEQPV